MDFFIIIKQNIRSNILCVGVGFMCQTYMEDFVHELYTRMDILEPHQLSYQIISTNLGIRVLHWYESSQALFLTINLTYF